MRVFVAGATGVLGRATVPRLIEAGHEVTGVARSPEKAAQLVAQGARPVEVDLFDPTAVRAAVQDHDAVVHMATSIPPIAKAWRTKAWATNDRLRREGTPILATAAREAGATRFVKESVCFFYADHGDAWIDEDSPIDDQPFSAATLEAERAAVAFTGDGRTGVALRFGLFYSADARALEESLSVARKGLGPMIGRPESYQPSIHVDDAATAIVASVTAPAGFYNVADDPITKAEWNAAFADAFGIDRRQHATPKAVLAAGGKKVSVLAASRRVSSARFMAATGWSPVYANAIIGLKAMADHWRQQEDSK
jgi:nucleoside-diphosphate-sugar epimerase